MQSVFKHFDFLFNSNFSRVVFNTTILFFVIPFHSSKAGGLTAILCGGQLSERWMDRNALCISEWLEINSCRNCLQYDAFCISLKMLLQRYIIIFTSTSLKIVCSLQSWIYSRRRKIFLIRIMGRREENVLCSKLFLSPFFICKNEITCHIRSVSYILTLFIVNVVFN